MALSGLSSKFTKEKLVKNRILLIGIAIAVFSVWYGSNKIYKPTAGAIRQLNSEIEKEVANAAVLKRLAALQQELAAHQAAFAKGSDVSWLVKRVSMAANGAGLKIRTLNSRPLAALKDFLYSSVNVAVTGTFHQLGEFVAKIEGSKEFIRIERLSFKKDGEFLEADIVISTYFSR